MPKPESRREMRKQMFAEFEQQMLKGLKPEDSVFYHHSSEDRIVLSHALFWVMTANIKGRMAKQKFLLLLRKFQEEMLEAYITESDEFQELLHYCNLIFEVLPNILMGAFDVKTDKEVRKLSAILLVAGGYGGDMPETLCYDLLDDIDFYYNRVRCREIERLLPELNELVQQEQDSFFSKYR